MSFDFANFQHTFLAAISHPEGRQSAPFVAFQQSCADTSGVRLGVYADAYLNRLVSCLLDDYPVLARQLGEPLFLFFAKAYVWRNPSRSQNMFDFGRHFADFLLSTQRGEVALAQVLAVHIARMERARTEVMYAAGLEGRAQEFDLWTFSGVRLQRPGCVRLLHSPVPLEAYWELPAGADLPAMCEVGGTYAYAVTRVNYHIRLIPLNAWQIAYLEAADTPILMEACAQRAAEQSGIALDIVLSEALLWRDIALQNALLSLV